MSVKKAQCVQSFMKNDTKVGTTIANTNSLTLSKSTSGREAANKNNISIP